MVTQINLKNYQRKALHEINTNYANGVKSQLLVMATGTGKTVVFCEFIKELISVEKKVLILVHRDELINQAERRLKLHTSEPFGIEKAERKANNENIVLASVQTLKGKRLKKFAKDYFDVIIIDECHRSTANSYMAVRNHFKKSHVLGVTATPERQDDLKITKKHFQKIAFTYNLLDAIKEGNLSNIRVWRVESEQDISDVKSNSDDLDQKALAKVLDNDEYLEFIYKTINEKAFNKKIMVFMPSVKMSDSLADLLNSKGLSAFSVNSNTPLEKRQEVLEDYKIGKIKVLTNCNIFTEGFDEPSIDCVIMARPTKSEIFYSQALGRMTRLFEGKKYGMLIDIGYVNHKHKLASIYDLIDEDDNNKVDIEKEAIEIMSKYSGHDIIELLLSYKKEISILKAKEKQENGLIKKTRDEIIKERYENKINMWGLQLKEYGYKDLIHSIKDYDYSFIHSNKKLIKTKLVTEYRKLQPLMKQLNELKREPEDKESNGWFRARNKVEDFCNKHNIYNSYYDYWTYLYDGKYVKIKYNDISKKIEQLFSIGVVVRLENYNYNRRHEFDFILEMKKCYMLLSINECYFNHLAVGYLLPNSIKGLNTYIKFIEARNRLLELENETDSWRSVFIQRNEISKKNSQDRIKEITLEFQNDKFKNKRYYYKEIYKENLIVKLMNNFEILPIGDALEFYSLFVYDNLEDTKKLIFKNKNIIEKNKEEREKKIKSYPVSNW